MTAKKKTEAEPLSEDDFTEHTFRLRPDVLMTFLLPNDLTSQDVKRLSRWLATLPDDAK